MPAGAILLGAGSPARRLAVARFAGAPLEFLCLPRRRSVDLSAAGGGGALPALSGARRRPAHRRRRRLRGTLLSGISPASPDKRPRSAGRKLRGSNRGRRYWAHQWSTSALTNGSRCRCRTRVRSGLFRPFRPALHTGPKRTPYRLWSLPIHPARSFSASTQPSWCEVSLRLGRERRGKTALASTADAVLVQVVVSPDLTDCIVASFAVKGSCGSARRVFLTRGKPGLNHRQMWPGRAAPDRRYFFSCIDGRRG